MLRRAWIALIVAAVIPASYVAAQETRDTSSVAEAAKRAREKKQTATKRAQVVTNDTLKPEPVPASAPTPTANPAATAGASQQNAATDSSAGAPAGPPAAAASPEDEEKAKAAVDSLKQQIKDAQQAADLVQRELSLEQDNFYRKQTDQREADAAGKQKLDAMRADLKEKQDALEALKAKLIELAGADALKEPAPVAPPPSAPQQ